MHFHIMVTKSSGNARFADMYLPMSSPAYYRFLTRCPTQILSHQWDGFVEELETHAIGGDGPGVRFAHRAKGN